MLSTQQLLHGIAHVSSTTVLSRFAWLGSAMPCSTIRFEDATGTQLGTDRDRSGSSSVHFVIQDSSAELGVRDVVYQIGGVDGSDDDPCPDAAETTNKVFRLKDTDTGSASLDASNANWVEMEPMSHPRVNHNSVILPTGEIFVAGGTDTGCDAVLEPESFFPPEIFGGPAGGLWVSRASHTKPRTYHSVAGLLPDGRTFLAGGKAASHAYHNVEIYCPAYYFDGTRPEITAWPAPSSQIAYSGAFSIAASVCGSSNSVERVVLLRSTSVTHAFDMNQRYVQLDFFVQSGSSEDFVLEVSVPSTGFIAPPGYYLLFVIDAAGLPSEGRWVRVGT